MLDEMDNADMSGMSGIGEIEYARFNVFDLSKSSAAETVKSTLSFSEMLESEFKSNGNGYSVFGVVFKLFIAVDVLPLFAADVSVMCNSQKSLNDIRTTVG